MNLAADIGTVAGSLTAALLLIGSFVWWFISFIWTPIKQNEEKVNALQEESHNSKQVFDDRVKELESMIAAFHRELKEELKDFLTESRKIIRDNIGFEKDINATQKKIERHEVKLEALENKLSDLNLKVAEIRKSA